MLAETNGAPKGASDPAAELRAGRLRKELAQLRSHPLDACPACRRAVAFDDDYIRLNGRLVHAACARVGVYEEVPRPESKTPAWEGRVAS